MEKLSLSFRTKSIQSNPSSGFIHFAFLFKLHWSIIVSIIFHYQKTNFDRVLNVPNLNYEIHFKYLKTVFPTFDEIYNISHIRADICYCPYKGSPTCLLLLSRSNFITIFIYLNRVSLSVIYTRKKIHIFINTYVRCVLYKHSKCYVWMNFPSI